MTRARGIAEKPGRLGHPVVLENVGVDLRPNEASLTSADLSTVAVLYSEWRS